PAFADLRLLCEVGDEVPVEDEAAKPSRGPHRGYRRQAAAGAVKAQQRAEVHIAHTVAVRQHERLALEPWLQPLHATSRQRLEAGVDEVHRPVVGRGLVKVGASRRELNRDARFQAVVVEEEPLYLLALVAKRDDKLVESVAGVVLHDVPQDWVAADLHHRLGPDLGFLGQAGTQAARQDDDLHSREMIASGPSTTISTPRAAEA